MMKNMKSGVLYYPVDQKFPAVNFVFVNKGQVSRLGFSAVQVTLAENHKSHGQCMRNFMLVLE